MKLKGPRNMGAHGTKIGNVAFQNHGSVGECFGHRGSSFPVHKIPGVLPILFMNELGTSRLGLVARQQFSSAGAVLICLACSALLALLLCLVDGNGGGRGS